MNSAPPRLPAWLPEDDEVVTLAAGDHWDAIVVPQHIGIATLAVLDTRTGRRPGPVIWETRRDPRLYFLVPVAAVPEIDEALPVRHLGAGCYVSVPGATKLEPPGPYWLAPPDPDEPGLLVDAELLMSTVRHVRGAAWLEWQPPAGPLQQLLLNAEQLNGRACVLCGAADLVLEPAGFAYLMLGGGRLGYPVVTCEAHSSVGGPPVGGVGRIEIR